MMATFVDQGWAFPDRKIGFNFKAAKQKIRNAFEGFDYIGTFEPAVYPDEELKTESGTGSLVSFHAHVIVWSTSETKLRAHNLKIAERFTPLVGDEALSFPRLDNLKTAEDFRTTLRYVTKMPMEGYKRVEQNNEVSQRHAKLEDVHYFWLIGFLRHHTVFDAWFAGGEGKHTGSVDLGEDEYWDLEDRIPVALRGEHFSRMRRVMPFPAGDEDDQLSSFDKRLARELDRNRNRRDCRDLIYVIMFIRHLLLAAIRALIICIRRG